MWRRERRDVAVRGGWLTCGCSMPCSSAHRPSVMARSPMRTRKEEPADIDGELETPKDGFDTAGAMRGELDKWR